MAVCECEQTQQSPYSPGVVQPGETVVYLLFHPQDIDKETRAEQTSLMRSSYLKKGELSVARSEHTTREIVNRQVIAPRLERKAENAFCGCWSTRCGTIRAMFHDDGTRLICVKDFGEQDYTGHACLGFSETVRQWTRQDQLTVRLRLIDLLKANGSKTLEECFAA